MKVSGSHEDLVSRRSWYIYIYIYWEKDWRVGVVKNFFGRVYASCHLGKKIWKFWERLKSFGGKWTAWGRSKLWFPKRQRETFKMKDSEEVLIFKKSIERERGFRSLVRKNVEIGRSEWGVVEGIFLRRHRYRKWMTRFLDKGTNMHHWKEKKNTHQG